MPDAIGVRDRNIGSKGEHKLPPSVAERSQETLDRIEGLKELGDSELPSNKLGSITILLSSDMLKSLFDIVRS